MKTCVLLALGAIALLAGACGDDEQGPASTTPTPAPATARVCAANPDPAGPDIVDVDQPSAGATVVSPLKVTGKIAAFEATFRIAIFDAGGQQIADQMAMSAEGQTLAPFSATVPFTVNTPTPACLWVYERSARDGLPIHVVQVPLTLNP
jgi:hypothetical protein